MMAENDETPVPGTVVLTAAFVGAARKKWPDSLQWDDDWLTNGTWSVRREVLEGYPDFDKAEQCGQLFGHRQGQKLSLQIQDKGAALFEPEPVLVRIPTGAELRILHSTEITETSAVQERYWKPLFRAFGQLPTFQVVAQSRLEPHLFQVDGKTVAVVSAEKANLDTLYRASSGLPPPATKLEAVG